MGFLAGKNAVVTFDAGDPQPVEDGNYEASSGTDEVTNLTSGGFYESLNTIKRASGSLTVIFDTANPPTFEEGDSVVMSITVTGGPGLTGPMRISRMNYMVPKPKAAVRVGIDFESNGAYTKS